MSAERLTLESTRALEIDIESALNPAEVEASFRDTRECAALALLSGGGTLLLSPPTPRPKKG